MHFYTIRLRTRTNKAYGGIIIIKLFASHLIQTRANILINSNSKIGRISTLK